MKRPKTKRAKTLEAYGLAPNSKFDPKYIDEARRLATIGVSQKWMAWYWVISEDSVTRWKEEIPAFAEALKKGESERNVRLLTALYQSAMGEETIRGRDGRTTTRRVPKNTAAMIFLAKNWLGMRDVTDQNLVATDPIKIVIMPANGKGNGNGGNGGSAEKKT